ncbi:carbon-nitrogen hydrolase family protein [Sulfitobacter guttiformis]|uniref:5-aminopentanamidase n=1 Tax=Sulfitobacter guttiformis TaxID=74349 RepID=A0A420DP57_9RHOB|nr:carbon-nitrogen hydrolase family protein [Sulfitobacter guttiformis]KIN73289.1 Hydrolase [Sulfitobacter guttiformis KCTC 32187]RKE95959.1 5-aminopentanamidase [Sulfitobacter guttiformis]
MKIALWQTTPDDDIGNSLKRLAAAVEAAVRAQADLLVSPEMFIGGYNIGETAVRKHSEVYEDVKRQLCDLAAHHKIALIIGLPAPHGTLPFNSCIAIDEMGIQQALYHKTHLYGDVDRKQFSPGAMLSPIFELGGWQIGLAICYDIEFPEVARDLALRGADLIITPTANMAPFDSVATRLVPARAEENAVYVAYCNYLGTEGAFHYNGLSCLCGPDGKDLVRAGVDDIGLFFGTLTRDALQTARGKQCHLRDRRPDLYGKSE